MSASSSGSNAFFGTALLAIILLVIVLLRYYLPLRSTPAYLLLPVFLALALPASIILLVPIDLASSAVPEDGSHRGIWLPERALLVFWRISYWLTFCLTWFVLPILGEYSDSGDREPKARIIYSLRTNLRYYSIVLASSIAGLVYFFISSGLDSASLKGAVIALAYAWGLVLAIYLMGHGLVAVPRRLYRNASPSRRLRRLQAQAPQVHEKLVDAIEGLEALEAQVIQLRQRKTGTARDYREWIEELAESSDMLEARISQSTSARLPEGTVPPVVTERYLADLTRKLKRARHRRIRFVEEWARCVSDAKDLQAILDSSSSKRLTFPSSSTSTARSSNLSLLTPYTRYHLHANILPTVRLISAATLALASLCIIWSEIFSRALPSLSLVGLSIIHHPNSTDSKIGFGGQVMAAAWLLYMMTAALTSVSEVKVWGNRALVRRHTYAESACWYASLVARLTVPLSYNFSTFVPDSIFHDTAFYAFLGQLINLTPLGTGFSRFFPIFILVPVAATVFGLYGRVKRVVGFGDLAEDEASDGTSGWREGKALMEREVQGADDALGLASRDVSPRPGGGGAAVGTGSRAPVSDPAALLPVYRDVPAPSQSIAATSARRSEHRAPPPVQDEDSNTNFFEEFAHRVKNTLDTADKPEWANFEFKRPRWMGGDGGGGESSSTGNDGDVMGRLFGGRGGVRL